MIKTAEGIILGQGIKRNSKGYAFFGFTPQFSQSLAHLFNCGG